VKARAEEAAASRFDQAIFGRPVHFVDNSPEGDRQAEATLGEIARGIGFKDVTFQFEPIAAALDYERQVTREEIALIADIGGGTSDFSIVRLSPDRHRKVDRKGDILANDGVRIGGTDFDRRLNLGSLMPLLGYNSPMQREGLHTPKHYFYDLATWSSINRMYEPKVMTEIRQVRREAAQGLAATISRADFVAHTMQLARRIGARIKTCLGQAGLAAEDIRAVFLTGGTVQIPHVRNAILSGVPAATVVEGDTFGAVGKGLTVEAERRFGGVSAGANY
jgi:hypothetical chaperone protein